MCKCKPENKDWKFYVKYITVHNIILPIFLQVYSYTYRLFIILKVDTVLYSFHLQFPPVPLYSLYSFYLQFPSCTTVLLLSDVPTCTTVLLLSDVPTCTTVFLLSDVPILYPCTPFTCSSHLYHCTSFI